jgi:hypothetical protein
MQMVDDMYRASYGRGGERWHSHRVTGVRNSMYPQAFAARVSLAKSTDSVALAIELSPRSQSARYDYDYSGCY